MKKIFAVIVILAITGCAGERENQVSAGSAVNGTDSEAFKTILHTLMCID